MDLCTTCGSRLTNVAVDWPPLFLTTPSALVAVIAPNIPAIYEAHFGVPMAGAVINPVSIRLNALTVAFLLGHSSTEVVMVDQEFFPLAEEVLKIWRRKANAILSPHFLLS